MLEEHRQPLRRNRAGMKSVSNILSISELVKRMLSTAADPSFRKLAG
jgi:hypothetical protein